MLKWGYCGVWMGCLIVLNMLGFYSKEIDVVICVFVFIL